MSGYCKRDNRAAIHEVVESVFGATELILDLPHNTYEVLPDGGPFIRKGSVRASAGSVSDVSPRRKAACSMAPVARFSVIAYTGQLG